MGDATVDSRTRMVNPKEVSIDAATSSLIPEVNSSFSLKDEQRTALKDDGWRRWFHSSPDWLW